MNQSEAKIIQARVLAVLQQHCPEFAPTVAGGSISQTGTLTLKIGFTPGGAEGKAAADNSKAAIYAPMLGLPSDIMGRSFTSRGETFKVVSLKPERPKFPVTGERADGKLFKFAAEDVRRMLIDVSKAA